MHNYYGPCHVIGCATCRQMTQALENRITLALRVVPEPAPNKMTPEQWREVMNTPLDAALRNNRPY